jgi:hypothetical protein
MEAVPIQVEGVERAHRVPGMLEVPSTNTVPPVSVLGDTGAEVNIIDESYLEGLAKIGSSEFVQMQPFSVSVAFANDTSADRATVSLS